MAAIADLGDTRDEEESSLSPLEMKVMEVLAGLAHQGMNFKFKARGK